LFPAGPLREPVSRGLQRAQAAVLVGEDRAGARAALGDRLPVLAARIVPGPDAERYRGERVAAFAGIGRPAKFYDTLRALGAHVVATRDFPDHYRYKPEDVMGMVEHAAKRDAVLITTAKDAVRLPKGALNMLHVLGIELAFDDPQLLGAVLAQALPRVR
ncbi:MAG: tetraacyldisaccharide 4'-kinase, partial [Rhodospirillales bacterium]